MTQVYADAFVDYIDQGAWRRVWPDVLQANFRAVDLTARARNDLVKNITQIPARVATARLRGKTGAA